MTGLHPAPLSLSFLLLPILFPGERKISCRLRLSRALQPAAAHEFRVDISRCLPPLPAPLIPPCPPPPSIRSSLRKGKFCRDNPEMFPVVSRAALAVFTRRSSEGRKGLAGLKLKDKAHAGRSGDSFEPTLRSGRAWRSAGQRAGWAERCPPCRAACGRALPLERAGGCRFGGPGGVGGCCGAR